MLSCPNGKGHHKKKKYYNLITKLKLYKNINYIKEFYSLALNTIFFLNNSFKYLRCIGCTALPY